MTLKLHNQSDTTTANVNASNATPQIREQMLVLDILRYEKSILGWFGHPGRTCETKVWGQL